MKRSFTAVHWLLTLLIAPFISQAIEFFFGRNRHQVVGLLEVYPITVLFSLAFSLPTFIVYLVCFWYLSKHDIHADISKFILILVAVAGIVITQSMIKGSMTRDIIIAYAVTAIIVGLLLRLKAGTTKSQESRVAT